MAINFPTSPATNDTYTYNSKTWKFNGTAWDFVGSNYTSTFTNANFIAVTEAANIVASSATGTINLDVLTASVWYYTANAAADFTLNFRGDSSTALSSVLASGRSLTCVFLNTNGATAYRPTAFTIDTSTSVTPKWQGGAAPTTGSASSVDAYSFTITRKDSTYTVFASQVRFA